VIRVLRFGFRSDGAQPHLVNIQFQKKVQLQVPASVEMLLLCLVIRWF
jgi:hypothetical protein